MAALRLETGFFSRPYLGEVVCGDTHVIHAPGPGLERCVLVDALGHGQGAYTEAERTRQWLLSAAALPPDSLLLRLHEHLRGSRGVAALVAHFDLAAGAIALSGVGNVELKAKTAERLTFVNSPGVLGSSLRKVRSFQLSLRAGDLFVLHTDGVSSRFRVDEVEHLAPRAGARHLVEQHGKAHDDAAVLIARVHAG